MKIRLDRTGSAEALHRICIDLAAEKDTAGLLLLIAAGNQFTPAQVNPILGSLSVPVFGGLFPEIICEKEALKTGSMVVALKSAPQVFAIPELSNPDCRYDDLIDRIIPGIENAKTAIVLVDAFSSRISALLEGLFNVFGLKLNYLGGGCGSLSMQQRPCLFTNQGLLEDHAVVALFDEVSGIGVSHGWTEVEGPFTATECTQNAIKTIDWQPAFEFYSAILKKHTDVPLSADDFYAVAQSYPFGLSRFENEKIVRDPFSVTADGAIVCVGEVPENCFIHIMKGDKDELIEAASQAVGNAMNNYPGDSKSLPTLLFDCISRSIFLQDRFSEELDAVKKSASPLFGALTIGEIGNKGNSYLELFNKTSVVGVIDL